MYLYRLCHELGKRGHEIDVLHCIDSYRSVSSTDPAVTFAEHPRVRRHELRSPFGRLAPLVSHQTGFPLLQSRRIHRLLAARPYDVIHFHNTSLFGPGILSTPAAGDPVRFYTAHEHWLVCPTHVLWKYDGAPCRERECLKCILAHKRPPQLWRYTNLLARKSQSIDQFFAPSEFTARKHAELGFAKPVECLPYFLDRVDSDWQNPGPRPQERPYFLFVGRLELIKGLQELIEVWKEIHDWDLLVAGSGAYGDTLRAMAASNPRIRFLGPQPQQELGALYYHAIGCVVPSITFETFGIVCIEAFARKTPVIVHDLGGLSEVAQNSGGGLTYRDRGGLLNGIAALAGSPELRQSLGEKGYEAFLNKWTTEAHLKLYFGWIERFRRATHPATAAR